MGETIISRILKTIGVCCAVLMLLLAFLSGAHTMFESANPSKALWTLGFFAFVSVGSIIWSNRLTRKPAWVISNLPDAIVTVALVIAAVTTLQSFTTFNEVSSRRSRMAEKTLLSDVASQLRVYKQTCGSLPPSEKVKAVLRNEDGGCPSWSQSRDPNQPATLESIFGGEFVFESLSDGGLKITSLGPDRVKSQDDLEIEVK